MPQRFIVKLVHPGRWGAAPPLHFGSARSTVSPMQVHSGTFFPRPVARHLLQCFVGLLSDPPAEKGGITVREPDTFDDDRGGEWKQRDSERRRC